MKQFTILRNLYEGDTYKCYQTFGTEQELLDWAATMPHLGESDWYQRSSIDENDIAVLPVGRIDDTEYIVNVAENSYTDDDGVAQVSAAYSYIQYKMVDQWSYTSEDITAKIDKEAKAKNITDRIAKAKHRTICGNVLDAISDYNEENSLDPDVLLGDATLVSMFGFISQSRANSLYGLVSTYTDITYYTAEFISDLKAYMEIELGL